eukprot:scaffold40929_cov62-Cyclotella_meneghiniana.AAC.3
MASDPMSMNHDDSDDKENSNRGNAMMAMDVDDDGKASNSNCLAAAAVFSPLPMITPTKQEIQSWKEVADWIDKKERVNSCKLFDAINRTSDAIRYCKKTATTCREARSFFDNYVPKIVSILLYELEDGVLPLSEVKPHIKTLLEQVLEVVSRDLLISAQLKRKCKTLTILTDIFDEVTGYQESDMFDLIIKFAEADGFKHLGRYLWSCAEASIFPNADAISSILHLLEIAAKGDGSAYINISEGIAGGFVHHVMSLSDEQLLQCGDDSVDIFKNLSTIILKGMTYPMVSGYFDLLREFVFKLISSSSVPLKLLGYEAMQNVIESNATFPPPLAYLVQGAGKDVVNGRYEFDLEGLDDGHVLCDAEIVYSKSTPTPEDRSDHVELTSTMPQIFKDPINNRWYISIDDEARYVNYNTSSVLPPHSNWNNVYPFSGSAPTLSPVGLMVPEGEELSSLGHDCWSWMYDNDILELVVQDSGWSDSEIQKEAMKAGRSILRFIGEMLDRVTTIIQDQSKPSKVLCNNAAKVFIELVETLLLMNEESFINIIPDFMMKTCDQLRAIVDRISTLDRQHTFDYLVFQRLLILRLMVSTGSPMSEIEAIPGAKLANSLPEAYTVEGALPSRFNGRYTLERNCSESSTRFVTYTKPFLPSYDTVYIMQIQQCLFGPEKGIWSISQRNESDSDTTVKRYFVNMSTNAGLPPETGWELQTGSGSWSAPTLTAVGTSSTESVQQEQENHESIDASSLDMTEQQSKLWKFVQELSDCVEAGHSGRTNDKTVANECCKSSLKELRRMQWSSKYDNFVECAVMVLITLQPTIALRVKSRSHCVVR